MSRRGWIGFAGALIAVAAIVLAYDALVITDEEHLEQLVADCTGPATDEAMDRVRERWIDLERQRLSVSALGESLVFDAGDEARLIERGRRAMAQVRGARFRTITSGVSVDGDRATVTMRLLSDRHGMFQLEWRLERHGDDWLAEHLGVRR